MRIFALVILAYTAVYFIGSFVLFWLAAIDLVRLRRGALRTRALRILRAPIAPAVTVLIPAHDEEVAIAESLRSVLALDYPELHVVVVNDGSTDNTLQILIDEFELRPVGRQLSDALPHAAVRAVYEGPKELGLVLVDKEQGGRSDALNAAICTATTPLVCIVDADSVLEQDGLTSLIVPMLEDPERTLACGGVVGVGNGCRIERGHVVEIGLPHGRLAMFQTLEYLRAFFHARAGLAMPNSLHLISGAFGLFRREAIIAAGGLRTDTVGEDFDLTMTLHERARAEDRPYRIAYVPAPICWTEVPERLRILHAQRRRWGQGAMQVIARHRGVVFHPKNGSLFFFAGIALILELLGPPILVIGLTIAVVSAALGVIEWPLAASVVVFWLAFAITLTAAALTLEDLSPRRSLGWRRFARLLAYAVIENFGYRQLVDFWQLEGMVTFRRPGNWGVMERSGLGSPVGHSSPKVG